MATTTENLGLKNPSYEEMADIGVINDNMEIIDKAYGGLKEDKVDKPSAADDGKIPRAKDGGVEWVEVGQPTDDQTDRAVSNWLDEHPEATTTVQDKSLTIDKLVVGTLGYVTPDMFGAVGDGATDDTQSFIKMLEANPKFINLKNKKYKVSSKLTVNFETRIEFGEIISDEIDYIIVIDSDNVVLDGIKLSNATYCGVYSHDCNNISIVNCTITNIRTEDEVCRGIYLERCYNVTIENTTIGNIICPNDGVCIHLLDESDSKQIATGNVIKNCRFYNATKRHLKLQQGVTVENCDFKETEEVVCTNETISIFSSNIKVVGCNFNVDCPVIITLGAINTLYELFQNIVICNNVFNIYGHNYQGAITIPKGLVVDVKNVTIEDNIFNGFNNTKNTESALSIRSFVNNLHFSNNSINDLISAIDFWEATDKITPSYITISNNIASVEENFILLKETTKLSKIFIGGNLLKYNSENYKNHPYIVRCVPSDADYDYSASFEFGKNSTDDGITNYRVY